MLFAYTDIIGYTGSILCIASFVSQLYIVYTHKSANDVSYLFILLQITVNVLYTTYDVIIESIPLFVGNATLIILLFVLIGQKYYYGRLENGMLPIFSNIQ